MKDDVSLRETADKVLAFTKNVDEHLSETDFDARKDGLDFLEVKNSLLLSYLIDMTQLMRSSKRKNAEEVSSALTRLNEMRVTFEKLRPMEKKLQYQIDKLLSYATSSSFASSADVAPGNEDPLSFRPNPGAMEASSDKEPGLKKASHSKQKTYQPPKLSSMQFHDRELREEKEEKDSRNNRNRMRQSELLQGLKAQYGDKPEEEDTSGGGLGKQREKSRKLVEREKEKEKFEEQHLRRLVTSRKDRTDKSQMMRQEMSNLDAISNLGDLSSGIAAFGRGKKEERRVETESERYANGKLRKFAPKAKLVYGSGNSLQAALYAGDEGASRKKKKKKKY